MVATPSAADSLLAMTESISALFVNSEPHLCSDYTYLVVDKDGNALSADLASKISIAGGNIYFNSKDYDKTVHHLQLKIATQAAIPVFVKFDILDSTNQCRTQNLAVVGGAALQYSLPIYVEEILDAGSVLDNFSNADAANCPHSVSFTALDFSPITSTQNIVLGFNGSGKIIIDSTHFDGVTFSTKLQLNTAWDEPLSKTFTATKIPYFLKTSGVCNVADS